MRSLARSVVRAILLLGCAIRPIGGQRVPGASLVGLVLADSTLRPLANAEVVIPELRLSARTSASGEYRIEGILPGSHRVLVRLLGFAAVDASIDFRADEKLERDFLLAPKPVELQPVRVADREASPPAKMRSFEERRRAGFGHFITRDELEKQSARRMSEILARLPGLTVRRGSSSVAWITSRRGAISLDPSVKRTGDRTDRARGARLDCYCDVYLDGALVYGGGDPEEPLFDVNSLNPSVIEGVEFFAGGAQTPVQYNKTGSACGVLLIWTRVGGS